MAENRITCPSCGARLKTAAQPGGRIKCPRCGTVLEVPEDEPDAEPPSRPATSCPKAEKDRRAAKRKIVQSEEEERSQHPEQEDAPPARPRKSKRNTKRAAKSRGPFWAMIGGGVLLGLALAVVATLALPGIFSRKPQQPQPPQPPAAPSDPLRAFIDKHGGKIDRKGGEIIGVELIGAKISDNDLNLLKDVQSLRQLRLDNTAITDTGLESLKQLPKLEVLSIVGTQVTEAAATAYKKTLPGCTISWSRDDLTNAMINEQHNLAAALKVFGARVLEKDGAIVRVDLGRNKKQITDEGLRHLKSLTKLEFLGVYGETGRLNDITDAGLAQIKEFKSLENLNAGWIKITDAGLVHVKELPKLKYLDLRYNAITDAGLEHLKEMKTLQQISLGGVKGVTPAGVERLRQHLPGCNILVK
ncbi:MAG TPA: hypothetical protein VH682_26710 [Gemmataceae bacterium]|jgi:uncharacterized Zn finger protein (UPF0148 family)